MHLTVVTSDDRGAANFPGVVKSLRAFGFPSKASTSRFRAGIPRPSPPRRCPRPTSCPNLSAVASAFCSTIPSGRCRSANPSPRTPGTRSSPVVRTHSSTKHRPTFAPGHATRSAMATKLKGADKEWKWQYVFPSATLSIDPRSGIKRRHHVHEGSISLPARNGTAPRGHRPIAVRYRSSPCSPAFAASCDRRACSRSAAKRK